MSSVAHPAAKINSKDRNRALLVTALAAGAYVVRYTEYGAVAHIPSKSDPATIYQVSSVTNAAGAKVEHCTCQAMQGAGSDTYTRSVVTWRAPDGAWRNNGVLPCSHILVDRFSRWWSDHTAVDQTALMEHTDGLAVALAQNGHYPYIPF